MDIQELNLSPREHRTLEKMGLSTLERIVLCYRDELGLGKGKCDAIIQRAKSILANNNIEEIIYNDEQITVVLSDTSKPLLISVTGILGIHDDLSRQLDGNKLTIFRPEIKPCTSCGATPVYICRICRVTLCINAAIITNINTMTLLQCGLWTDLSESAEKVFSLPKFSLP